VAKQTDRVGFLMCELPHRTAKFSKFVLDGDAGPSTDRGLVKYPQRWSVGFRKFSALTTPRSDVPALAELLLFCLSIKSSEAIN